jgi:small subunit ribosomal protein S7e
VCRRGVSTTAAARGFCRPSSGRSLSLPSPWQLEKKFSGKHVVIIGQRRIMRKPSAGQRQPKQKRPRSRTLTAVHESILEDLVYPTEIVGKHTRYRLDGSKIIKVYLDPKEAANVEYKVDTFATVYKRLTGKEVKL